MRFYHRWAGLGLAFCLLLTGFALGSTQTPAEAQSASTPPNTNPNVVISFPPPVYVVRGFVEVRGTVNLPNISNYFLEFRQLGDNMVPLPQEEPWFPASLAQTGVKIDEVLLEWDTTVLEDGLYEIRLRANVSRQTPIEFVVSPLRVQNILPDFLIAQLQPTPTSTVTPSTSVIVIGGTPTPGGVIISRPTLAASPSPTGDPIVTATTDANVRTGDSTAYPVVGSLAAGTQARLVGISATGSGWYYIELSNGRRGFVSPGIVNVSGNVGGLQRISPPPVPATPTPTRPPSTGDAIANGIGFVPAEPRCNEAFQVQVNVTNIGSIAFATGGTLTIRDVHFASGASTSASMTFPALTPGQNFVVVVPILVGSNGGQDHQITATVDSNNNIIEDNEGNNNFTSEIYRLRRAGCP